MRAIESLIASLIQHRGRLGAQAEAKALGKIGDERAVTALIYPAANDPESADVAISALQQVLERTIKSINTQDIRTIAQLDKIFYEHYWPVTGDTVRGEVDCSVVKQLAQQELVRRE